MYLRQDFAASFTSHLSYTFYTWCSEQEQISPCYCLDKLRRIMLPALFSKLFSWYDYDISLIITVADDGAVHTQKWPHQGVLWRVWNGFSSSLLSFQFAAIKSTPADHWSVDSFTHIDTHYRICLLRPVASHAMYISLSSEIVIAPIFMTWTIHQVAQGIRLTTSKLKAGGTEVETPVISYAVTAHWLINITVVFLQWQSGNESGLINAGWTECYSLGNWPDGHVMSASEMGAHSSKTDSKQWW